MDKKSMILICGLGNPGKQYQNSPHNVGFLAVEKFAKKEKFPQFELKCELKCEVSEGKVEGKKVVLAKPQTFMNNSGEAIKLLKQKFFLKNKEIWVVHDDWDLPLGRMKISFGKGSAGHKGVESAIKKLKTKNFVRFRIGIRVKREVKSLENFVLEGFLEEEQKILEKVLETFVLAVKMAIVEGIPKAMTIYNQTKTVMSNEKIVKKS